MSVLVALAVQQAVAVDVRITAPGEAYGHHGDCSGWNGCGDAATCALLACQINGFAELVSFGSTGPCTGFDVCHLFADRTRIQCDWGNWCEVSGVSDIVCRNPSMPGHGCVAAGCGNYIVESGEQCDDGNLSDGDCCDASCQYEASGSACAADGNPCTDDVCDGAGVCGIDNAAPCDDTLFCNGTDTCSQGVCGHSGDPCADGAQCAASCDEAAQDCFDPALTPCDDGDACTDDDVCDGAGTCAGSAAACDDANACTQDSCDSASGCVFEMVPATGCKSAGKSLLALRNSSDDGKDQLVWTWLKGAAVGIGELGVPAAATDYTLCIYAGTSAISMQLPAGTKWQAVGRTGFKFGDLSGSPDGVAKGLVRSGVAGKAKAAVKGKGVNLPDALVPPLSFPVTAQLVNDTNQTCFESIFPSTAVIKNDERRFKAKRR